MTPGRLTALGAATSALALVLAPTMPRPEVGSLTPDEYLNVLAYLLQRNGASAGSEPLRADAARLAALRVAAGAETGDAGQVKPTFIAGERGLLPAGTGPTGADLAAAATSADWLYHTHDHAGTRHSPLAQIDRGNVKRLAVACAYQVGDQGTFQTGPIVHAGVMYVTTPHVTAALDAATCRRRWRHVWQPKDTEVYLNNRGVAVKDGYVVRGTADGYLVALDAKDGALLWARQVARPAAGETITMPPLIWDDLVVIGPAGSENSIQGWVGAFRLTNGEPIWRFNTVPRAGEPGAETWANPSGIPMGGGAVWTPLALDAVRGEVYVPVTNPAPDLPADLRPGKNLYTNALVALDARTGALRWYKQLVPNDSHDWDLTQVSPLFRGRVGGSDRDVVAATGKDGILRLLDRTTHEQLWATPITTQLNVDAPLTRQGVRVCPGILGGVEWNGPAYHAASGLLIVPVVDWCFTFALADTVRLVPGEVYLGGTAKPDPTSQGWITAVNVRDGTMRWRYRSARPMVAAVTTTGGGLVLAGETTGDFIALDAETGSELYRFNTGGAIGGGVVTYSVGGRQYIAVASGRPSGYFGADGSPTVFVFVVPGG